VKRILHVDMDAFFAAIEQQQHPELRGKPVVVGGHGEPTERRVVSTASYEARRFGIHSAMPLRTAYRLCPDAVYLPVDIDTYAPIS
jgi:DNA polymerase IV